MPDDTPAPSFRPSDFELMHFIAGAPYPGAVSEHLDGLVDTDMVVDGVAYRITQEDVDWLKQRCRALASIVDLAWPK